MQDNGGGFGGRDRSENGGFGGGLGGNGGRFNGNGGGFGRSGGGGGFGGNDDDYSENGGGFGGNGGGFGGDGGGAFSRRNGAFGTRPDRDAHGRGRGGGFGGGTCYNCGEDGHTSRSCTNVGFGRGQPISGGFGGKSCGRFDRREEWIESMVCDIVDSDEIMARCLKNMASSFDSQLFVDCTFECQDQLIGAHKAILVSQSPVFKAMFENYLKEAQSSTVEITDIEFVVFKEMLRFMYSCETPKNLSEIARKLFIASNKYQLIDLKKVCENYLADHLNPENFRGVLALGHYHDAPQLKKMAIYFAKSNLDEIIDPVLEILANDMSAIDILK